MLWCTTDSSPEEEPKEWKLELNVVAEKRNNFAENYPDCLRSSDFSSFEAMSSSSETESQNNAFF